MRSHAAALLLALAACPLPQPLAEVGRTPNSTTVSTPIMLPETATPSDTVISVGRACPNGAQVVLAVTVEDVDTTEAVEVRWFLNYGAAGTGYIISYEVPASTDPNDPLRPVAPLAFRPYGPRGNATRTVDVVEAVVSNGFLPLSDLITQPVQRAAASPYVTQVQRWVIQYVDEDLACL